MTKKMLSRPEYEEELRIEHGIRDPDGVVALILKELDRKL
jgi:hypothetical protein